MTGYQSKKDMAQDKLTQPAQEPVAWIQKDMECDDFDPDSVTCEKPARAADGWEWIPLYATPPAAQPAQEPSYWLGYGLQAHTDKPFDGATPLYTAPPQRAWIGLTDEQTTEVIDSMPQGINGWMSDWDLYEFASAVLAKFKEKNT